MSRSAAARSFLETFHALEPERTPREPGWLGELRRQSLAAFAEHDIPTQREEDWRFTPLATLARTAFAPAPAPVVHPETLTSPTQAIGPALRVVFLNGRFSPELSALEGLPHGVHIGSLAQAIAEEPERLKPHLAQCAGDKTRPFYALNTALAEDGLFIELEAGAILEPPIHALFIQQGEEPPSATYPRNLVVAGPGSRACVIEHFLGSSSSVSLTNTLSELILGREARLEHVKLQQEGPQAYHIGGLAVRQEAGSQLVSHSLSLGARLMRFEIQTTLLGEGAHCELNGLYLGRDTQHVDHHTTIDHATPHTTSEETYKGILDGRARGVFHGRIHVRPDAQKISAEQTNRNLLLSDNATITTKPQLEIYADDVRCTHGAAIGCLDEEAIFYLRTRGIGSSDARRLLTFAFASSVTLRLPTAALRKTMESIVLDWLPAAESAE